jgi:hypothetical protein
MFKTDSNYQVKQHTSQFFAGQLITREWAQPADAPHQVYPASSDVTDPQGNVLVTAYALLRPDRQWALLLVNKDQTHPHSVRVLFHDSAGSKDRFFSGQLKSVTFGSGQYQWHPDESNGYPDPAGPPAVTTVSATKETAFVLPAASITVLRGKVE